MVDASGLSSGEVAAAALKLITLNLDYVCVWGPDCERVHDLIDEVIVKWDLDHEEELKFIMTTWHDDEPLNEATWFFLNCAWPQNTSTPSKTDWIAVSVKHPEWAAEVQSIIQITE